MAFCRNTTTIFNGNHATQLHLVSGSYGHTPFVSNYLTYYLQMEQELGLVPEDPDYVNPYRKSEVMKMCI